MENVDLLISEEAEQNMDLKSAFAPAVPRRAFFRLLLGDPRQSPGGVADGQRAHRTLLLKAPIFFHEYGRRVGMVPRSSLKGGKNSLMVEKITRTTTTTQKPQPKAQGRVSTIM